MDIVAELRFSDITFWLYFFYFFGAIFLAWYLPGSFLINRLHFPPRHKIVLSFVVGLVFWALQGILFGYLGMRFLTYVYLGVFLFLWIRQKKFQNVTRNSLLSLTRGIDKIALAILVVGSLIQILTVWFIGYYSSKGLEFCCFWPDSMYHLALTSQIVQSFPPIEPGMSGVVVKNYHYLSNLVTAELVRVFQLPLLQTHYQYMAVFVSLLLGFSVWIFAKSMIKTASFARWLLFFVYFSGDIIFLLLFFRGQGINFDVTLVENATTIWFSPSRIFAMAIIFAALTLVPYWIQKKSLYAGILACVLFGSIVGFKVYLGIFVLSGLGFVGLYLLFKKELRLLLPVILAYLLAALLYFPINKGAGGLFFVGLWRFENFAIRPEFNLMGLELSRQIFLQHSNWPRIIFIEGVFILLYLVSLFGMFLLGFLQSKKSLAKLPGVLHLLLLAGLLVCLFLGFFFLQDTGGANTIQFLFTVYIVGSIYAALACSYFLSKLPKHVSYAVIVLLVLLISGRVIRETYMNISDLTQRVGYFIVGKDELEALLFVRQHIPKNAVLTIDNEKSTDNACYYISIVTERSVFLCGTGILLDHGQKPQQRQEQLDILFEKEEASHVKDVIVNNEIRYMYMPVDKDLRNTGLQRQFKEIYRNNKVKIYYIDYQHI